MDVSRDRLMNMVEDGRLAWAFNISAERRRQELRILAISLIEQQSGPVVGIGATKNLRLPEVLGLILPQVRPTLKGIEVQRLLACSPGLVKDLHLTGQITRVRERLPKTGPNASPRFTCASIARFLEERRIT